MVIRKIGMKTEEELSKMVDVVLSDMSAPWEQTTGFWKKSLSQPYRMMNTSGINFADHAGSMVSYPSLPSKTSTVYIFLKTRTRHPANLPIPRTSAKQP